MRIAILSDIHANRVALEAVLDDTAQRTVERFWFLGDAVGYGPDPVAPLLFIKRYLGQADWVMGNHDAMLAELLLPDDLPALDGHQTSISFSIPERDSAGTPTGKILYEGRSRGNLLRFLSLDEWEATGLQPIQALKLNRAALAQHPEADEYWRWAFTPDRIAPPPVHQLDGIDYVLVHARQMDIGRYLYSWQDAVFLPAEFRKLNDQALARGCPRIQFYGHTHVPTFVRTGLINNDKSDFALEAVRIRYEQPYPLNSALALINPGSVGQPRDLDRRAAYAILDTGERTVTFYRLAYDWQATAIEMRTHHYPPQLVNRLKDARPTKETPDDWIEYYKQASLIGSQV